jgi:hypothetical protein
MSNILIEPNFFPTWITQLVFEQHTIRNESIDIYFPSIPIELQNYDLICVGIRDDIKYIVSLKILACTNTPLKGPHKIQLLPSNEILDIPSLTYLKKNHFCFYDCLSFERCTFIVLHDYQKLIRLKNIRGSIYLPQTNTNLTNKKIANRTLIQANNLLRSIYASFQRDLHGLAPNEIHEIFLNNINQLIQQLTQEQLDNK